MNIKNKQGESFVNILLNSLKTLKQFDTIKRILHFEPLQKHYDRLGNESKLLIQNSNELIAFAENSTKLCSNKKLFI